MFKHLPFVAKLIYTLALLGEAHWNRLPWPGTIVTICMRCLKQEVLVRNTGTNKPPPTQSSGKVKKWHQVSQHLPESSSLASILAEQGVHHPEGLLSQKDWLKTTKANPVPIKLQTATHVAEQFSWVPLHYCCPTQSPFPIKSLALPAQVSPRTIHFPVLEPTFGSWRGSSFL